MRTTTEQARAELWDAIIRFANHDHRWMVRDAVEAKLDALLSATEEAAFKAGWQPIETAPKDGTLIVLSVVDEDGPVVAFWEGSWTKHHAGEEYYVARKATHWMPLPPIASKAGSVK